MIIEGLKDDIEPDHYLANPLSIIYGLVIMIWITLFTESWRRKQNYIGNEWLVRSFQDATTERPDFKHEMTIDADTQHYWKIATRDSYKRQLLIGVPISVLFMAVVVMAQVLLQWVKWEVGGANDSDSDNVVSVDDDARNVPLAWRYLPGIINSLLIIIFGFLYKWLSQRLVDNENHRYVSSHENSLINKIYMFQFVNTYISNFVAIAYNQNFSTLTLNLVIILVFKQVFMNVFEFYQEKILISRKVKKVEELFAEPIRQAETVGDQILLSDLRMHKEIEMQYHMKPGAKTLVFYYNEAII